MSERPAAGRTALDRFLSAVPVAIAVIVLLSIFFWEASARKSPTIFTDELEWTDISRALAHTGHAARRGQPIGFKSLYAFLIAPAWWLHSTASAYAAIKYLNTIVMALAAVPVYLLARTLVSKRAATLAAIGAIATPAFYYAALILPEVLAYPFFALCAYVSVRALAGAGRRWTIAAIALSLVAIEVRSELMAAGAALALAAVWLWLVGPRGRRFRAGWSVADHVGAVVLLIGVFVLLNRLAAPHAYQWAYTTQYWKGRIWHFGLASASALTIGLAVLPVVGGLASLWLPERRHDPAWRAFAAYLAAAIVTFGTYTGIKGAYLSTVFGSYIEERNLIYLGPLLMVGTAVFLSTRRPWLPGVLVAVGFVTWLVTYYGYQLGYPYNESPGYGIAAMANRAFFWNQHTIRLALFATCAIVLGVLLLPRLARLPQVVSQALLAAALLTVGVWMMAAEVTSARGAAHEAKQYVAHLPEPLDWIDRATGSAGTVYLGQQVNSDIGLWLFEFWNPSLKVVDSIDATAPGPGPTRTPDLKAPDGELKHDPGLPYVLADNGVEVIGRVVRNPPKTDLLLTRLSSHPWRLKETLLGRSSDGWMQNDSSYAYFGPARRGTLHVVISRSGFCPHGAPGTEVTVRVGPVALDQQGNPVVRRATSVEHFHLSNCTGRSLPFPTRAPVAVQVHVSRLVVPSDYGISDSRLLGAQVGYSFSP